MATTFSRTRFPTAHYHPAYLSLRTRAGRITKSRFLTPPSGKVRGAFLTPANRLVTVSDPDLLRSWDLSATKLPAEAIADYARLLAGRRLNSAGVLLPLGSYELAELRRFLSTRFPELFAKP